MMTVTVTVAVIPFFSSGEHELCTPILRTKHYCCPHLPAEETGAQRGWALTQVMVSWEHTDPMNRHHGMWPLF